LIELAVRHILEKDVDLRIGLGEQVEVGEVPGAVTASKRVVVVVVVRPEVGVGATWQPSRTCIEYEARPC